MNIIYKNVYKHTFEMFTFKMFTKFYNVQEYGTLAFRMFTNF